MANLRMESVAGIEIRGFAIDLLKRVHLYVQFGRVA